MPTCREVEDKPAVQDKTGYYLSKLFSMSSVSLEGNRILESFGFSKITSLRNSFSD